jgi:RNA polymerase sigma-70 factor (ECF subfamily)
LDKLTDTQLMAGVCQGQHNTFAILVKRHQLKCYRLAWRLVFSSADAEDIVQDSFLKIWKNPKAWNEKKNTLFTTWLYRLIINSSIDFKRKHSYYIVKDPSADEFAQQAIPFELPDNQKVLQQALQQLKPIQQQVINLFYYEELSSKQTSQILQISVKAVERQLFRARKNLAYFLEKNYDR